MTTALEMFTIYKHPSDYPDEYVCRRQLIGPGVVQHDANLFVRSSSLELCRALLHSKKAGLTCLGRQPQDDPVIVETWI